MIFRTNIESLLRRAAKPGFPALRCSRALSTLRSDARKSTLLASPQRDSILVLKSFIILLLSFLISSAALAEDTKVVSPGPADLTAAKEAPIAKAKDMVSVPVLAQQLKYGDVISEDDIVIKEFPANHLHGSILYSENDLIGKTPKRSLSPNRPIRKEEITGPQLVEKGALITMIYKVKNLEISTSGEALDRGGMGDMIRVKNQKSNLIVTGTIKGSNLVKVAGLEE